MAAAEPEEAKAAVAAITPKDVKKNPVLVRDVRWNTLGSKSLHSKSLPNFSAMGMDSIYADCMP